MLIEVYSAESCAGCKVVKGELDKAGIEYKTLDIMDTENMGAAQKLGIRNIPVTVLYKDGELLDKIVGSSKEAIQRILQLVA